MLTNKPFPLDLFPARVREAILAEFKGSHPTTLQVARVSNARWLSYPRIGPAVLARMRSATRGVHQEGCISPLASMTDIELLGRYELLQDELERIQAEIKANMTELRERGIVPLEPTMRQFRRHSDQAVHQEIG